MAFTRLMLTTRGKIIQAKAHQGKGFHITRIAIGDGVLSAGESLITRSTLVHEVLSLKIDAIQLTQEETVSAVVATLTNKELEQEFYFRELAICTQDPDTGKEVNYLVDYAGEDAELIPDKNGSRKISERLRFLIHTDNIDQESIKFEWSGNPLYLVIDDIDDSSTTNYSLWSSKRVSDELAKKAPKSHTHTPGEAGADPVGSAAAVEAKLVQHTDSKNNPHGVTAAQAGADPAGSAAAVETKLGQHTGNKSNPHGVSYQQAGAEKAGAVAEHNAGSTSHVDIRNAAAAALAAANEAKSIAEGRSRAVSYTGYSSMVAAVNLMTKTAMRVGDNLLIEAIGVPDLWVSKVESAAVIYTYTTDEALEAALETGRVQMGYYKLTMLETPKVDLSGYVPTTRTINGKPLTANITLTATDVGARPSTWVPSWTDVTGKPGTFTPSAHTHTPAQAGVGKALTFTGAASGTYDGTADKTINIPEGGGSVLQISFESVFSGKAFTVTGGGENYTGTVPASLKADVTVKNVDTEYTAVCNGYSSTVTTGPYFGQCQMTLAAISTILNENTWAKIRKVSDAGTGANYWKVGDTKTITINGKAGQHTFTNLSIDAFIIGFNHNASREGSNRIHFQIGKISGKDVALVDSKYGNSVSEPGYFSINSKNVNNGGWNGCQMRTTVLGNDGTPTSPPANTMLAAFPSDLRAVMKPCTKYSDNTGGSADNAAYVTSTTDYLFLLSEFEYHGARTYANSAEQSYQAQYDYYKAGNSKIKYRHDSTGTTAIGICRSVYSGSNYKLCLVSTAGTADWASVNYSFGVAPCFFV